MILFINACVRSNSRTKRLAERFLSNLSEPVREVILNDIKFPVVDEAFLKNRDKLVQEQKFDDSVFDLARQFASADEIIIAAPFWDLSFPASLKQYFEQINVIGITFCYTDDGRPSGLCRANKLTYITTAGGEFFPADYGFGYIKALCENFYGIKNIELIKATGLDIIGADIEEIMNSAEEDIGKV